MSNIAITWTPRLVPLVPVAVVAQGSAAIALAKRLLERSDEELARLAGAQSLGMLIVLSDDPASLPWVDGVTYLGRDRSAPSLLTATTYQPVVPLALVERAIRMRFPALTAPFVILPDRQTVLSLGDCRKPIARVTLKQWCEGGN